MQPRIEYDKVAPDGVKAMWGLESYMRRCGLENSAVADSAVAECRLVFDPARLVDGIELSDDSLPAVRSAVYAVSYRRRNA